LAKWFGGLEIIHPTGSNETVLRQEMVDQAELFGVLGKIRDLGLTLISLQRQSLLGVQPVLRQKLQRLSRYNDPFRIFR
jgi:hypothetical protein